MTSKRPSRLQRHILAWLVAEAVMTGNISRILEISERGEETVRVQLTAEGRNRVATLTASCD